MKIVVVLCAILLASTSAVELFNYAPGARGLDASGALPVDFNLDAFDVESVDDLPEFYIPTPDGEPLHFKTLFVHHNEHGGSAIGASAVDGGHLHITHERSQGRIVGHAVMNDDATYIVESDSDGRTVVRKTIPDDAMCVGLLPPALKPLAEDDDEAADVGGNNVANERRVLNVPILNSKPGARGVIFLDWDGYTVTGTSWNTIGPPSAPAGPHATLVATPYDRDGDDTTFSTAELAHINDCYERMREDFLPFDVTVTTDESVFDAGIPGERMRVLMTEYSDWYPGAGGVAYLYSYWSTTNDVCWVFADNLGNDEKNMAEAGSHEVGHTLGLSHDGIGAQNYYGGHPQNQGVGNEVSWSPIMGVGYYTSLSQWSKGEYLDATESQDDLAWMTKGTGSSGVFNFDSDDHGDTSGSATAVATTDSVTAVIGTTDDVDMYAVPAGQAGDFVFTATPNSINRYVSSNEKITNLDILMTLYDSDGTTVLDTSNPDTDTDATISYTLSTPTTNLYVAIDGTGRPNVLVNDGTTGQPLGYSDYGSLGEYTFSSAFTPSSSSSSTSSSSSGVCGDGNVDAGEQCDPGTPSATDCCTDTCQFENSAYECRASAGLCDVAETCSGSSGTCPADTVASAGTQCRAAAGLCDVAEQCDGSSATCPTDQVVPAGTECRAAAGICDAAESCDGSSPTCPTDDKVPAGTECRAAADLCDAAEACDGTSDTCPADDVLPAGTECRAASGVCEAAATCDGSSATCPANTLLDDTTVCREAVDECDVEELCTGASATCPADAYADAGTECDDGDKCTADACDGSGLCAGETTDSLCKDDEAAAGADGNFINKNVGSAVEYAKTLPEPVMYAIPAGVVLLGIGITACCIYCCCCRKKGGKTDGDVEFSSVAAGGSGSGKAGEMVEAIYAYDATDKDELNLNVGDKVRLVQTFDDGWAEGTLFGKTGVFPINYTKPVSSASSYSVPASTPSSFAAPTSVGGGDITAGDTVSVTQAYTATAGDELSLRVGDKISVLQVYDDGWANGRLNGQTGAFPLDFTTKAGDSRW